ncbi:PD-(D/E)XK nuclease family transposase [Lachnospiraceae bacterium CLA-AA-H246]|uniref:PD-(D/E)XK nuclease family transposase n=1 Tax=Hominisplanchenecus faecis TaxID=2885351 RepID=A0ABS8EXJ4_9FIRM|nr:PD-(D/E)XK nuclease family transposase [Hominisplanchenecus faecis]MCC2149885.1 PD-(D/E)XK nuclease family transposase [Hominisplanchenecus faecis]MCM0708893.1 PD-(D/E)XK nuclease family transposase [Faecalicatena sp. BF-R-105]
MSEIIKGHWSEETLKAVDKLCLFDDDFMSLVFDKNIKATEYLLNTIFEREDMHVLEVKGQHEYKNVLPYRCIIIDIRAVDSLGKVYDIEVQRADAGAIPQRARFHSALVDSKLLKGGQEFKEIQDSYVIFITQNDVIGDGLPLYHVERIIKECNRDFADGSHIIYVNGAYKNDNSPIGRLVHDFRCTRSVDMFSDVLKNQVKYYKETEGGREVMCQIIDDVAESRAEAERIDTLFNTMKNLMDSMKWTSKQALEAMRVSDQDQAIILKRL